MIFDRPVHMASFSDPPLEKGRIDEEGLEKELDFMLASDIAGIFPCATTGEFTQSFTGG